jgi:hypothetical protein
MHVELVVPALFHSAAAAPALEMLLARGRRTESAAASLEAWLGRAFELGEDPLPAGALSALANGLDPGAGHWLRADPVHLRPDRDRVLLFPSAGFEIAAGEAQSLCEALNRHFEDQFSLHPFAPDRWGLCARSAIELHARAPIEIAGRDIDAELPHKRWHAQLNEIQMALYQHAVNTAREERGAPVINGVWLWGAGDLPDVAQLRRTAPWQSVSADDPATLGLAKLAGMRHRAPGAGAAAWLERAPEDGRHLVQLDRLREAHALGDAEALAARTLELEAQWFAPLLAALRAGRVGMVTLHAPDAGASFETTRGDLRRFWRRRRPLASYRPPAEARA